MFDKLIELFASKIAEAVVREVAKALPGIADQIADRLIDELGETVTNIGTSAVREIGTATTGIASAVVSEILKRIPFIGR